MKMNFHHHAIPGVALAAQSVTNTTVNGNTIAEPWRKARQLVFFWIGGAFAATVNAHLRAQGQKISDGNWENLKEKDGVTDLIFTDTKFDDGGAAENGALIGTLDLERVDSTKYKAVRISFQEEGNAAALGAVGFLYWDLFEVPGGATDELWDKQRTA